MQPKMTVDQDFIDRALANWERVTERKERQRRIMPLAVAIGTLTAAAILGALAALAREALR